MWTAISEKIVTSIMRAGNQPRKKAICSRYLYIPGDGTVSRIFVSLLIVKVKLSP
jgi:hypothetical protein